MNRTLRISLASAVFATLAVSSSAFAAPPAQPGQIVQPAPTARGRMHHRSSPAGDLLGSALGEVTLRPDQRAFIDGIRKEASAKHAAVKKAKKALLETLAAQVGAGKMDRDAIKKATDELMLKVMDEAKAQRGALDKLHALLDKAQRAQLASALDARVSSDDDKHAGRDEMRRLTDVLKLTPEQRKKIGGVVKDVVEDDGPHGAQAKERDHKMLEAFKADKYDADKVLPMSAVRARMQSEIGHLVAVLEHLVPVMSPEQRAVAADLLLEHANGNAALKL
jgi:Spy/CpxP family protein refolding chaperone